MVSFHLGTTWILLHHTLLPSTRAAVRKMQVPNAFSEVDAEGLCVKTR